MTTTDYRYTASGLDNVILVGLPVCMDDAGERVIKIPAINQLHRVLTALVAKKPTGLQGREVRFLRTELGLTQAELARVVGRDAQTVGRWERGETTPDQSEEMVIRAMALAHVGGRGEVPEMADLAGWTVKSAMEEPFRIDASDPPHYRPMVLEAA